MLLLVIISSSCTSSARSKPKRRTVASHLRSGAISSHSIQTHNWERAKSHSFVNIHPVQFRDRLSYHGVKDNRKMQYNLCETIMSDGKTCIYYGCDAVVKDTHSACIKSTSKNYTCYSTICARPCNYTAYLVQKCITSSSSAILSLTNTFLLFFATFIYCKTICI